MIHQLQSRTLTAVLTRAFLAGTYAQNLKITGDDNPATKAFMLTAERAFEPPLAEPLRDTLHATYVELGIDDGLPNHTPQTPCSFPGCGAVYSQGHSDECYADTECTVSGYVPGFSTNPFTYRKENNAIQYTYLLEDDTPANEWWSTITQAAYFLGKYIAASTAANARLSGMSAKFTGTVHDLKTHREPFVNTVAGIKKLEVRLDDRGYSVGDVLNLQEVVPHQDPDVRARDPNLLVKSGRSQKVMVTHIQLGYGLPDGYVAMSVEPLSETDYMYLELRPAAIDHQCGAGCPVHDSAHGESEVCPKCNGTGEGGMLECAKCDGIGRV